MAAAAIAHACPPAPTWRPTDSVYLVILMWDCPLPSQTASEHWPQAAAACMLRKGSSTQDAAVPVFLEVVKGQRRHCTTCIAAATHQKFSTMPRVAARQLLALAAIARSPAVSSSARPTLATQPAASLWSSAVAQPSCDRSCTCIRCSAASRSHHLGCGCGRCRGAMGASLGGMAMSGATAGRSCFATLDESQRQV